MADISRRTLFKLFGGLAVVATFDPAELVSAPKRMVDLSEIVQAVIQNRSKALMDNIVYSNNLLKKLDLEEGNVGNPEHVSLRTK